MSDEATILDLLKQLVTRRDHVERVMTFVEHSKPGAKRMREFLVRQKCRYDEEIVRCARALVAGADSFNWPELDLKHLPLYFSGEPPWYVDADATTVAAKQQEFGTDWISELLPD